MTIKILEKTDIPVIIDAFQKSGWQTKPISLFEKYLEEQGLNQRLCFVAYEGIVFAGYVTLKWNSDYKSFSKKDIPEISDLNVLPNFRNKGIGSQLIKKCEESASKKSPTIGIAVGLYPDYGPAQRLYVKHGYVPDGYGATYNYDYVIPGKEYPLDDDLVLWFTKRLKS